MEKRKWSWKKKSLEKSPGGTESSGSISSNSERDSDDQEGFETSPNHATQSPEVPSKSVSSAEDTNENVKRLTEKLSAALVNISAKDDLVKQHSKVAEEAVAGWEKAENEMVALKRQLEAAFLKNLALEDRISHLDGALKECVRQLRQARVEQEQKIHEALVQKTHDWESTKFELESQLQEFQSKLEAVKYESPAHVDPDLCFRVEYLEKDNSALKLELLLRSEELEVRTIERDLSTQAAETASRQHLESIKKVAKLEAECRRLKAMACKSSSFNDHRSVAASSIYVESLTDSQSDGGEQLNAVDIDILKMRGSEQNRYEPSCSDSWASALIAELDQFKNEKTNNRNNTSSSIQIHLMDDFLEMERLAALPETPSISHSIESEAVLNQTITRESCLRSELELMIHRTSQLEEQVQKTEAEKREMKMAIETSELQLRQAQVKLDELQKDLHMANESIVGMELEAQKMTAQIDSLQSEIEKERSSSAEIAVKCYELEEELSRKKNKHHQSPSSKTELKIKQADLAVAAGKLDECQRTIASLGKQLKSLATLEDFLMETTASTPGPSKEGSLVSKAGEEWKLHCNETFLPKRTAGESSSAPSDNKSNKNSPPSSSSSSTSSNDINSEKNRNGFSKFFSRTKSGIHLEIS